MYRQPTKHHNCAMCGKHCQTKDSGPCVKCKERIDEQIKHNLFQAEFRASAMLVDFGVFQPRED